MLEWVSERKLRKKGPPDQSILGIPLKMNSVVPQGTIFGGFEGPWEVDRPKVTSGLPPSCPGKTEFFVF